MVGLSASVPRNFPLNPAAKIGRKMRLSDGTPMNIRFLFPYLGMSPVTKTLLLFAGFLSVILPLLPGAGLLPLGTADFVFLFSIVSLFAAYRPGWIFLLLVSVLPMEIVNLAPTAFGADVRAYQFLTVAIFLGLGIRFLAGRKMPGWPKPVPTDFLLALIPAGSVFAAMNAPDPGTAFRFSVILFSFYVLYGLCRIYIRSSEDVGRIVPFVVLSGLITSSYAVVQNVAFLSGHPAGEVMPGRPNAGFPEADWLGGFLVVIVAVFLARAYRSGSRDARMSEIFRTGTGISLLLGLPLALLALVLSVSRSAWLGTFVSAIVFAVLPLLRKSFRPALFSAGFFALSGAFAFLVAFSVPLSDFDLFGRAGSIGSGLQTITVSCDEKTELPEHIGDVAELAAFGCRHIDLEDIPSERSSGRFVTETDRDDPNVSIRKETYRKSLEFGRQHPVLGIGWGSVTDALGTDGRGTGLNASNVFLEVWLGSGILGLAGLVGFLGFLMSVSLRDFFRSGGVFPLFLLSATMGSVVFDFFNSGILLGFVWVFLGVAGSYLSREEPFTDTL